MKIYFAYEKMRTKTRFEKEAWGNSEMAYSGSMLTTTNIVIELWEVGWTSR